VAETDVPAKDPKRKGVPPSGPLPPEWGKMIWYIPIVLFVLWIWQDIFTSIQVHNIPYSQFKAYVAKGEVTECDVKQDEIVGRNGSVETPAPASVLEPKTQVRP